MPPCDEPGSIHDCIHRIGVGVDRSTSDWFFAGTQRARQHHASMSWRASKRIEQLAPELASVSAHRVLVGCLEEEEAVALLAARIRRVESRQTPPSHIHTREISRKGRAGLTRRVCRKAKQQHHAQAPPRGNAKTRRHACPRRLSLRPKFPLWIPGVR
jgi:hypothetical protein